jgi:circadian clock protein KaiC
VVCNYPESKGLEDHYINITNEVIDFKPRRVVVDSLSALERVSTKKGFSEFVIALTSFIKHHEIAGFFTSTTSDILGGSSITDTHISNITDTIILLRYLEIFGEILRGITVMKMRGSTHEKLIRNFSINEHGMEIKKPFRNISGIFTGHPTISLQDDADHVLEIFKT